MLSFSVMIQNFNPNKHDIMLITTHFVMFDMIDVLLYINCTQVWHVPFRYVTMSSIDFSFQNLIFLSLFEFSAAEIT